MKFVISESKLFVFWACCVPKSSICGCSILTECLGAMALVNRHCHHWVWCNPFASNIRRVYRLSIQAFLRSYFSMSPTVLVSHVAACHLDLQPKPGDGPITYKCDGNSASRHSICSPAQPFKSLAVTSFVHHMKTTHPNQVRVWTALANRWDGLL